jgi:protoheme IX farnesyltransferase
MTTAAGFLLVSTWHIDWVVLIAVLLGNGLIIASGCTINNLQDRNIDKKMTRTKNRALVSGKISQSNALIYAILLGIVGFTLLTNYTNNLVVLMGIIGLVDYTLLYAYSKRRSVHGTIIGSISGSTSITAGYLAARGHFDAGAAILFLIMVFWQMPHFYAIAIRRSDDYAAAGIPVLPLKKPFSYVRQEMIIYTVAFIAACIALSLFGYTGIIFALVMGGIGVYWLLLAVRKRPNLGSQSWAREMFGFSLIVLLVFSLMLSIGAKLP